MRCLREVGDFLRPGLPQLCYIYAGRTLSRFYRPFVVKLDKSIKQLQQHVFEFQIKGAADEALRAKGLELNKMMDAICDTNNKASRLIFEAKHLLKNISQNKEDR